MLPCFSFQIDKPTSGFAARPTSLSDVDFILMLKQTQNDKGRLEKSMLHASLLRVTLSVTVTEVDIQRSGNNNNGNHVSSNSCNSVRSTESDTTLSEKSTGRGLLPSSCRQMAARTLLPKATATGDCCQAAADKWLRGRRWRKPQPQGGRRREAGRRPPPNTSRHWLIVVCCAPRWPFTPRKVAAATKQLSQCP